MPCASTSSTNEGAIFANSGSLTAASRKRFASAVAASLNNVGPGLADVTMTFRDVSDSAKWVCAIAMVIGRLEIFALLLLLTPAFWER